MMPAPNTVPRSWWLDALTGFAFFVVALALGKTAARIGGPALGLLFFLPNIGLAYWFGRSAWRGLLEGRSQGR